MATAYTYTFQRVSVNSNGARLYYKDYKELEKVKKFRTSRPLISWRNSPLKKVRAHCIPPHHKGIEKIFVATLAPNKNTTKTNHTPARKIIFCIPANCQKYFPV